MTPPDPIQIQSQPQCLSHPQPSAQEIAVRAYQVWEAAGRPSGRAVEHWLTAEALLRNGATPRPVVSRLPGQRYGLVLSARTLPAPAP